jgi:cyclase
MLRTRVIPVLLLKGEGIVKTIGFKKPKYLGDPRNIVKIFNDKEVDELILLDITATSKKRGPNYNLLNDIVSECFMPVCYGGDISSIENVKKLSAIGIEKFSINTNAFKNPGLIKELSRIFGSQSIIVSIDVKKNFLGNYNCYIKGGEKRVKVDPIQFALEMQTAGAGEILINSIDRDGTMMGYDNKIINKISQAVDIPVIACGGAGSLEHLINAVKIGGASAVAAGSFFVFQGVHHALLISYPDYKDLEKLF